MTRLLFYILFATAVAPTTAFVRSTLPSHRASIVPLRAATTIQRIDDSNYIDLLQDSIVLVDACAAFCGPCKLIEPVLEQCAQDWADTLQVAKFSVDQPNPMVKMELVAQNVLPSSLPYLILFDKGQVRGTWTGVITEEEMNEFLRQHLPPKETAVSSRRGISLVEQPDEYMLAHP